MADVKISALPASTTPLAGTEVLPIVQSSTTRQVSVANLTAGRAVNALSITASSLTSGRVTYAGTAGLLQDDADFTFNGTTVTMANDASVNGLTVGKGASAIATNTALGVSALSSVTTGLRLVGLGNSALKVATTGSYNIAIGYFAAGALTTASGVVAIGDAALFATTTGGDNVAIGSSALVANITGASNVGIGTSALQSNTTASYNTAVGFSSASSNLTGIGICAIGAYALSNNNTGQDNTAVGSFNGTISAPLFTNTTGSYNVAIGTGALRANTTASNNTAVGYQAGYTNTTGAANTYYGYAAGYTGNGSNNTFIGYGAGYNISSGSKNSIVGLYNGNQGGLDIRTASNFIVLSDGDGNPRGIFDGSGNFIVGATSAAANQQGIIVTSANASGKLTGSFTCTSSATSAYGIGVVYSALAPNDTGSEFYTASDTSATRFAVRSNGGIANYSANNVNLSDRREKTNFTPANSYLDKICSISVQTFNYIDQNLEQDAGLTLGVVAQDVQAVAPELVMESNWGTEEEPKMRLSIYQTDLQYALMKALQELKAEVDALKTQIGA